MSAQHLAALAPKARRWPTSVAVQARKFHADGWTTRQIARLIEKEHGVAPSPNTVKCWVDQDYAERRRKDFAHYHRQRADWQFTFPGRGFRSSEYQAAFIRRLRKEGAAVASIAAVCRVVFADDSWTYGRVRYVLEGR